MVVILAPLAALTGIEHERTGRPFMCTVQAPHCATPQPYLVPVRPTCSRIAHSRGVVGSTFTSLVFPLIVRRAMASLPRVYGAKNIRHRAPEGKLSRVGWRRARQESRGYATGSVTHSPESQLFELRSGLGGPTAPVAYARLPCLARRPFTVVSFMNSPD